MGELRRRAVDRARPPRAGAEDPRPLEGWTGWGFSFISLAFAVLFVLVLAGC